MVWVLAWFVVSTLASCLLVRWLMRPRWRCEKCDLVIRAWRWEELLEAERIHVMEHYRQEANDISEEVNSNGTGTDRDPR
jgi:hypothetical protein